MQAIITQEEWEEYQRLKRESTADGKVIDLRVAEELENVVKAFKSEAIPNHVYYPEDMCRAIEDTAYIIREKFKHSHPEIHHK